MKLIAGLGNPGRKYKDTKHNAGFMVLDRLADKYNSRLRREERKAVVAKERIRGEKIILAKPQTFMNKSGESLGSLVDYYNLELNDVLVVYDDLDLDLGAVKIKPKGGHGGHNGLKSIIKHLNSKNFARIRIGIGRPEYRAVKDYVLSKFSSEEWDEVDDVLDKGVKAAEFFIDDNLDKAMNQYN
ncbi:MAG: aminoacyl-tRNA hydrolase [Halanaerobacter sp.]